MHQEMVRATRYRQPLSVLVVDLDGLKRINDEHGHEAGNQALRSVAAAIRGRLREADLGGRLGGDEFAVLAPNTDRDSALVFGERLRALVAEQSSDARLATTVSVGIASLGKSGQEPDTELSIMRAADAALYRAKRAGGNRAVV
jgi:diguanylate cyclase (GGDEF)-like protein